MRAERACEQLHHCLCGSIRDASHVSCQLAFFRPSARACLRARRAILRVAPLPERSSPVLRWPNRALCLKPSQVAISSQCAAALEHLAAYHYRQARARRRTPRRASSSAR
eukprot:6181744-Pleurochrysis_carterae.AAC.7